MKQALSIVKTMMQCGRFVAQLSDCRISIFHVSDYQPAVRSLQSLPVNKWSQLILWSEITFVIIIIIACLFFWTTRSKTSDSIRVCECVCLFAPQEPKPTANGWNYNQARFPSKRNRLRCVRCVNENRKKRKRLRWQAANHGCHCYDRAFLLVATCSQ